MLPNSIERTTPILGYNPYAFIMGEKSRYVPNMINNSGGGLDYFARNPEDMYKSGEKVKKGISITPILKGLTGLIAIIGGSALLLSGGKKVGTAKTAAKTGAGTASGSSSKGIGSKILGGLTSAKNAVVGGAKNLWGGIKKKLHKGTP